MSWIIAIVVLVIIIVYVISKEYNEGVEQNVTQYGGMELKYSKLVAKLSQGCRSKRITKDSAEFVHGNMTWRLDYVGGDLEIRAEGWLPPGKTVKKKWTYHHTVPENVVLAELEAWAIGELSRI